MRQLATSSGHPIKIVVLGAGFGGLYMIRQLARKLKYLADKVEIILLDQHNYFLFSPFLHEVVVEMVEMHHVVHPVRQSLHGLPVRFHETSVQKIDLEKKNIKTDIGDFAYDYLVIALGSVTNFYGLEDVKLYSFELKNLSHAVRLRNHILTMLEMACNTTDKAERQRLLTFVQAGAGYTGLETITDLRDFVHTCLEQDYPELDKTELRFMLLDALPALPIPMHQYLTNSATAHLSSKGISLKLNTPVKKAGSGWVEFANGERVATSTLIWTAGVTAHPNIADLPGEKGSLKRIKVTRTLQLPGYPEVFALGDCAQVLDNEDKPLPPTAQVVNQQAPVAANNLLRLLHGRPTRVFHFKHMGELASLGEFNAIAEIGPMRISGFLAWLLWRTIYLLKMPWWRVRVHIAIDWTLSLLMRHNTARIDFGQNCPQCPAFPTNEQIAAPIEKPVEAIAANDTETEDDPLSYLPDFGTTNENE